MSDLTSENPICEPTDSTVSHSNDETCHGNPPAYSLDGPLVPMIPRQNDRYVRPALVRLAIVERSYGSSPKLFCDRPPYIAQGWSVSVNPEGSPFYIHRDKHLITDDPIQQAGICDKIMECEQRLRLLVETEGLTLPDDYECYITFDATSDRCKYYYADHTTQTVFWLEELDPERHDIGMAPVCSVAQMRTVLASHRILPVPPSAVTIEEGIGRHIPSRQSRSALPLRQLVVLAHLRAETDQLTSTMSTFPYDAQQCKTFLQIIDVDMHRNQGDDLFQRNATSTSHGSSHVSSPVCWNAVAKHRYHTFFGEDHARVSREQTRFEVIKYERPFAIKFISGLLFNLPKTHTAELDGLASDDVAYAIYWHEYAVTLLRGWRDSSYLSAGLLMITATSVSRPNNPISAGLGSVSIVLALGGLVTSGVLLQWYADADTRKFDAPFVATHLARIRCPKHGFEPMAQVYSLPRALVFWSIIFLALHMLSAVVDLTGLIAQAPALFLAGIFLIAICQLQHSLRSAFTVASGEK
ncbi:hypothetical protein L226DRAFT_518511 [Lentinus tigrinus ALCF2SS1-7]|uniref:uncharacterized protein n=1 Tax=Lentinus tigrinus ALCF2SS1-7 TaxID=1328758 RepID=UPI001166034A|nr:hypothetical protein L226DRAFT_518511 [Lentinus tigrinus ALCF2SS1-7]